MRKGGKSMRNMDSRLKTGKCKTCSKEIFLTTYNRKFCSTKCLRKDLREKHKEKNSIARRKYYSMHREKELFNMRKWKKENHDKICSYTRKKYWENPELAKEIVCLSRKKHPETAKIYNITHAQDRRNREDKYRKERIDYRIKQSLRKRIRSAIMGFCKSKSTLRVLGCTVEELKNHLESKFSEGMTWDNYGYRGWHIDHIKPCALFNLERSEEQQQCFHYTNLQPLWAKDNMKKGKKYEHGKRFENRIKDWHEGLDCATFKWPDVASSGIYQKAPCDRITIVQGKTFFFECKHTNSKTSLPLRNIQPHQMATMLKLERFGVRAYFLIEDGNKNVYRVLASKLTPKFKDLTPFLVKKEGLFHDDSL